MTEPSSSPNESPDDVSAAGPLLQTLLGRVAARPDTLREILDTSSEALVAFDANRIILHANPMAEKFFGYEHGVLATVSTDMLLPARLRQPDAPPMVPFADVMQIELPGLLRDGSELPIEWTFGSVPADAGSIFVMTVRDRAAMNRAIDALRASEERFRLLVEGVHEYAMFMLDPAGNISSWNKGAERSKGWSADEIIGKPYDVFFTPEDRAAGLPQEILAATIRDGRHEVIGWRMRKDGTRFRASVHLTALRSAAGELRGFAKITRDMTEKLEAEELERRLLIERAAREAAEAAEQRVRASEERLRRLQRVTAALSEAATPQDVAAVVLDQTMQALDATGGAVYALSQDGLALEMLDQRGHPVQSIAGFEKIPLEGESPLSDAARKRTPAFYESFEACAQLYPRLREAIGSGGFEASVALPLLTHGVLTGVLGIRFPKVRSFDQSDRWLLLTLSELCAQTLERARLLAAERAARADAESANRSKDEFLAMLGHELRNPLAPIVTALSLMKRRDGDAPQRERAVIERQVSHLVRLVDDLLDVSRITQAKVELKKERVELGAIVARAIELSSPLLEQRRQYLSVMVPEQGLMLHGDVTRLSQVVSNLLTNAAKYTQAGGNIEIAASGTAEQITLTVRDNGMGIDAATLPHVFELFTQQPQGIERSHGGLGLGLAIVKSLVSMHNGTVSAFSEGKDKGSVFTVTLPPAPRETSSAEEGAGATPRESATGHRVLVVDDNADAAELLAEILSTNGHVAAIALSGPDALHLAREFRPDIALLDIGLPVMDGYELARRLRDQMSSLRLIAVTGYGQAEDRARAHAAGFDMHMTKPVDIDSLRVVLG